jgi:hypothetical protein
MMRAGFESGNIVATVGAEFAACAYKRMHHRMTSRAMHPADVAWVNRGELTRVLL